MDLQLFSTEIESNGAEGSRSSLSSKGDFCHGQQAATFRRHFRFCYKEKSGARLVRIDKQILKHYLDSGNLEFCLHLMENQIVYTQAGPCTANK